MDAAPPQHYTVFTEEACHEQCCLYTYSKRHSGTVNHQYIIGILEALTAKYIITVVTLINAGNRHKVKILWEHQGQSLEAKQQCCTFSKSTFCNHPCNMGWLTEGYMPQNPKLLSVSRSEPCTTRLAVYVYSCQ